MLLKSFTKHFFEKAIVPAAIFILAGFFACPNHRNFRDDFITREIAFKGAGRAYRIFIPRNRDPNRKLPVMLFLHGSGSRGDDNEAPIDLFNSAIEPVKEKIDFIVVIPQCRQDTFWSSVE